MLFLVTKLGCSRRRPDNGKRREEFFSIYKREKDFLGKHGPSCPAKSCENFKRPFFETNF